MEFVRFDLGSEEWVGVEDGKSILGWSGVGWGGVGKVENRSKGFFLYYVERMVFF